MLQSLEEQAIDVDTQGAVEAEFALDANAEEEVEDLITVEEHESEDEL